MSGQKDFDGPAAEPHRKDAAIAKVQTLPKELRNLLAGGVAGMIAKSFVAPIDRIKILYQVTAAHFRLRNVPGVAYSIIQKEGPTALWKGNFATMIRVFPYSGIQFMVFDRCKTHFLHTHEQERKRRKAEQAATGRDAKRGSGRVDDNGGGGSGAVVGEKKLDKKWGLTPLESLISGSFAGAVSVVITYPLDLTRAQLAVLRKKKHRDPGVACKKKGFSEVLVGNYTRGGIPGLFRGITPTLLGILPYSGIAFTINEQTKRKIQNVTGREPTTFERMQCGALSGLFAQSMTYPLEVTRRRMQTIGIVPTSGHESGAINVLGGTLQKPSPDVLPPITPDAKGGAAKIPKPPSMFITILHLFEEQGLRGFFKGVSMNWLKGPVAFSISFTMFDIVQGMIETAEEKAQKLPRRLTQR